MKSEAFDTFPEEAMIEQLEDLEDSKLINERAEGPFIEVELSDLK